MARRLHHISNLYRRMIGYSGERWVCHFWFVGWDCLSVGAHVCLGAPNIEIHLPFGFVRIGRMRQPRPELYRALACWRWQAYWLAGRRISSDDLDFLLETERMRRRMGRVASVE